MIETTDNETVYQSHLEEYRFRWISKFMRNSNLDELPQLFNVIKGDMSLVGPRPHELKQNQAFEQDFKLYKLRYDVKPGLTGLAQISGFDGPIKNEQVLISRIKHDLIWVRKISLCFYFVIIIKTFIIIILKLIR